MAAESSKGKHPITKLYDYVVDRLERTVFFGLKFTLPKKFVSPLGFLGVLTFITFIVLGLTGAVLMIYYIPGSNLQRPCSEELPTVSCTEAYGSVDSINFIIPYGFHLRNIHYHASNAMVLLAVLHLYYQYFSGRFKIRNEVIWVTGVLLGAITILEAYTGYDLIFNERALLAINIGASLNNAAPLLGVLIKEVAFGAGFLDLVLRLYAYHVFIVPVAMIVLMFFHFPRYLVFDIPVASAVVGAILMIGGLFPVEMGSPFSPDVTPAVTVPEWYFTGLYAFLRTGADKFTVGILIPTLFILMFLVIPFVDKGKKFSWKDRPFFTALAITSITQAAITTTWGFYISPDTTLSLVTRLFIEPGPFWAVMIISVVLSYGLTYAVLKWIKVSEGGHRRGGGAAAPSIRVPVRWAYAIILALVGFQILLNALAYQSELAGFPNITLFHLGAILVAFGITVHVYRYATQ
jgi:ubiquinol-cytochrome c reductase cytochrome b subunit